MLAIFRDEQAAQQALDASPIRFALEKLVDNPDESSARLSDEEDNEAHPPQTTEPTKQGIDEILRPSQLMTRTLPASIPNRPSPPTPSPPPMPFESDSPSPVLNVRKRWTKWFQVTLDRSRVVHQDYIERQPYWKQFEPMKSMAQEDLAKQVPHHGLSDVSKRPPNAHRTPNRVLKLMSDYVEHGMPTLRGMVQDSEGERGFRERRERRVEGPGQR